MGDRRSVEQLMQAFAAGWKAPHAHAWDDLLADDVWLYQPLLPHRQGRAGLADEYGRLLHLLPDLHGEVHDWHVTEEGTVIVNMVLVTTLSPRRELRVPVTDRLTLDDDGRICVRQAEFDPTPALQGVLATPNLWPRWWRSGVAPLTARRHLTDRNADMATRPGLVDLLALGRLVLAVAGWLAPDRSARLVGLDPHALDQRYLLRIFAGRAAALGLGTLTTKGTTRRRWQQLGLLVDLSDTAAGIDRRLSNRARTLSLLLTGSYAIIGIAALARSNKPKTSQ